MSMDTLHSDFSNGRLSDEEYERNGISFEENKEIELEKDYIEYELEQEEKSKEKYNIFYYYVQDGKEFEVDSLDVEVENKEEAGRIAMKEFPELSCTYRITKIN